MWFDSSVDQAYREEIEPAIEAADYRAVRVDGIEHAEKIDDRIIAEIEDLDFSFAISPVKSIIILTLR